jgi:nucleotide-binding universal stress UspA family protein
MYQRILVPLDGSDTARLGLQEAIALAQPLKARLLLLTVLDDLAWLVEMSAFADSRQLHEDLERHAHDLLAGARAQAAEHDVEAQVLIRRSSGQRTAEAIVAEVRRNDCDLVVMGTHGRKGLDRLVLGSEAMGVVQTSPVPVLLVRSSVRPQA